MAKASKPGKKASGKEDPRYDTEDGAEGAAAMESGEAGADSPVGTEEEKKKKGGFFSNVGAMATDVAKGAVGAAVKTEQVLMVKTKEGALIALDGAQVVGAGAASAAGTAAKVAGNVAEEGLETLKTNALVMSDPVIDKLLGLVEYSIIDTATSDPYMWGWIKRRVAWIVDAVWEDVTEEVKDAIKEVVLKKRKDRDYGKAPCCCGPAWMRAGILYHWFPYDKSIFGKIRDPIWWLLKIITMIPVFGIRPLFFLFLLLLQCLGTPRGQRGPDEFQLISYILGFKGLQFFTGGILGSLRGAAIYYYCLQNDNCDEVAPGRTEGIIYGIIEFVLNIVLVWIAFALLPFAGKHAEVQFKGKKAARLHRKANSSECERFLCFKVHPDRGGRLNFLLYWDIFGAFLGILTIIGLMVFFRGPNRTYNQLDNPNLFAEEIYWAKVVYSFTTLPFFLFVIPGLQQVLTHSEASGYNRHGWLEPLDPLAKLKDYDEHQMKKHQEGQKKLFADFERKKGTIF